MTELVRNGPYIPGDLMNLLEDERVVFFCGAGVSMGTGLPSFGGLVQHIYDAHRLEPDPSERSALDLPNDKEWRDICLNKIKGNHPKYDKALGLLERPERLGSARPDDSSRLRGTVIKRLSMRARHPFRMHRAILNLSETGKGRRLVTTNFDERFSSAARSLGKKRSSIDAAPKLPVPNNHGWHSIVHLHGRLKDAGASGNNLVLTAADFGRAYLTERWAARFVTELFRGFTVIFVGYNIDDPVMSYLVDALAAERVRGAAFNNAYAFAEFDGTTEGREAAERAWDSKNVVPMLYEQRDDQCDQHKLLEDTLVEWARIRGNPFTARTQIALREISKFPDGNEGPVSRNVAWALNDPVAAEALANSSAINDKNEFAKLAAWLDVFHAAGLFTRSAENNKSAPVLIGPASVTHNPPGMDTVGRHLCRWIANHLHVPQVLEWIVRKGGHLHPDLRHEVRRKLANEEEEHELESELRRMWTIVANERPVDVEVGLWLPDQMKRASPGEQNEISRLALRYVVPRLVVRPGPLRRVQMRKNTEEITEEKIQTSDVEERLHLELAIGPDNDPDYPDLFWEIVDRPEVLAANAYLLTGYLSSAIDLLKQTGDWHGDTSWDRKSIADHDQDRYHENWTVLIKWARDSYFALANVDRITADVLLSRWQSSREPLFHRLLLHALTADQRSDINLSERILLHGRQKGLWHTEMRREVLRFLRVAGARLPRTLRTRIVTAILKGPSSRKRRRGKSGKEDEHEIGIRLKKLKHAGVRLNKRAALRAQPGGREKETQTSHRDEFRRWHGEVRWIAPGENAPPGYAEQPASKIGEAVRLKKFDSKAFGELAFRAPKKCGQALNYLHRRRIYPADYWRRFMWTIDALQRKGKLPGGLQSYISRLLANAPTKLLTEVGSTIGDFVGLLSNSFEAEEEESFAAIWFKAWESVGSDNEPGRDDVLNDSLNSTPGKLAKAAIDRMCRHDLCRHDPQASKGLPAPVKPYFDAMGSSEDGHLARVMLASQLYSLFIRDETWTEKHLLSRMRNTDASEAKDLWASYGRSPGIGPNLLAAIKEPFLAVLLRYEEENSTADNLIGLFVGICLDIEGELTAEEIRGVVNSFPEPALVGILRFLNRRLEVIDDRCADAWRKIVRPWMNEYWPKIAEKKSKRTSAEMVDILLHTGDAFTEAVPWALPYLNPIAECAYFWGIQGSRFPEEEPDATLFLLREITPDDPVDVWVKQSLRETLDKIKKSKPALADNHDFRRLYKISTAW